VGSALAIPDELPFELCRLVQPEKLIAIMDINAKTVTDKDFVILLLLVIDGRLSLLARLHFYSNLVVQSITIRRAFGV
jgi:hypothetical protein